MYKDMAHFFHVSFWCHADDSTGHNLTNRLPLFANDIVLGHHSHHGMVNVDNRETANTVLREQACRVLPGLVFCDRNYRGGHNIFSSHAYISSLLPFRQMSRRLDATHRFCLNKELTPVCLQALYYLCPHRSPTTALPLA